MKRSWFLIGLLLSACSGSSDEPRADGKHSSALGFAAAVPESWVILDGEQIRENPELFAGVFASGNLGGFDEGLVASIRANIEAGSVEYYYPDLNQVADFKDNVNVQKSIGRLPQTDAELEQICPSLESELAKAFGRPISVSACELRPVGEKQALFIHSDGAFPKTRMMQYQLQKSRGVLLIVTATTSIASAPDVGRELSDLVDSIQF